MVRAAEVLALCAVFVLALVMAPFALAVAVIWFVGRLVIYASALKAEGNIVDWMGQGKPEEIEQALAFPRLSFVAFDGVTRVFTSRMGFNIYDDPPPQGAQPIRYHLKPRLYAEIDDKAHWFTGPTLAIALALLGSFIATIWRTYLGGWF